MKYCKIIENNFDDNISLVCEEVCGEKNLFDDGQSIMVNCGQEEVKEMAKHSEKVEMMEERVKAWIKRLDEILKESEQIRRENDSSGIHPVM